VTACILETCNLTKRFPCVIALRNVSFNLLQGEVHAICGENGAGKSTLIKLLSGIHPHGSYEGELRVDGGTASFHSIRDAEKSGIAVITQEFALVDELNVAENIFLGREPMRHGHIDWLSMHQRATALLADFGLAISSAMLVKSLGVGHKQLLEIIRAIDKKSRVLVLDEPTAALSDQEVAVLLEHLRRLREAGTTCIYISHKLNEVFAIADRITVLRDGASVITLDAGTATVPLIIKHMVGREITDLFPRKPSVAIGKTVLGVHDLTCARNSGEAPMLKNISFELHEGEVLGIGGLMGAGRTELLMHLFGAWGVRLGGTVHLRGKPVATPNPTQSIRDGLVLASEDRRRYGLILSQTVSFNLSLSSIHAFTHQGKIDAPSEYLRNQQFFDQLRIKAPSQASIVSGLSGGNQQKVVLGKALMTGPSIVFLDEPTRGIDVGAKLEVYELINRLTAEGKAVVLVSSELPELMGMSDRVLMLCEGRVGGEFSRGEFTQERLLAAAMGRRESAAA